MSDTPITDEEEYDVYDSRGVCLGFHVPSEKVRDLERRLAKVTEQRDRLFKRHARHAYVCAKWKELEHEERSCTCGLDDLLREIEAEQLKEKR